MEVIHDVEAPISWLGTHDTARGHGHTTAAMFRASVRSTVRDLHLHCQGIHSEDVASHWLRAGGAMAMKLNGCHLITIMKTDWWTSLTFLTFLTYIHNQIAHMGANVTHRMANLVPLFSF